LLRTLDEMTRELNSALKGWAQCEDELHQLPTGENSIGMLEIQQQMAEMRVCLSMAQGDVEPKKKAVAAAAAAAAAAAFTDADAQSQRLQPKGQRSTSRRVPQISRPIVVPSWSNAT
jgi:hypothetical protein